MLEWQWRADDVFIKETIAYMSLLPANWWKNPRLLVNEWHRIPHVVKNPSSNLFCAFVFRIYWTWFKCIKLAVGKQNFNLKDDIIDDISTLHSHLPVNGKMNQWSLKHIQIINSLCFDICCASIVAYRMRTESVTRIVILGPISCWTFTIKNRWKQTGNKNFFVWFLPIWW